MLKQHKNCSKLNEEDLVLLNSTNIILQKSAKRASKKLSTKLIGPFKIVQKILAVTYRLKLPETLLRKEPPEIATKDPKEHEVKAILDKRTYYRHLQYLVKWKDHPLYNATWKPLTNLENYKDLVKEFEKTGKTVLNEGE
ncbi:8382_t:CDS:2, partial [Racocetra persica]